tara:strand:+ start:4849 stop:6414 length:1566 start_codon:yes stop_codon:yes gene_type:complete
MATMTESLVGKLSINDSEWKAGLARASTQFKAFSGKIGKMLSSGVKGGMGIFKSVGGLISGIGGQISGLLSKLGGLGGLITAGGIVAGTKKVLDLGGALSDTAAITGIAVEDLVILGEQFRQGGLDANSVAESVVKMNKAILDTKGRKDLFQSLGINQAKLKGKDAVTALNDIIAGVRNLDTIAEQQNALGLIFGEDKGPRMMTLVADTTGFEKAKAMVGDMAGVLGDFADPFDYVSDNLIPGIGKKLDQIFTGWAAGLIDPLTKVTDWIVNADFTSVGKKLGAQLMWAWEMFQGLWAKGTFAEVASIQLTDALAKAAQFFGKVIKAVMKSITWEGNLIVLKHVFDTLILKLAVALHKGAAAIGFAVGGAIGTAQGAYQSSQASAKQVELDAMVGMMGAGLFGQQIAHTGKLIVGELAKIKLKDLPGAFPAEGKGSKQDLVGGLIGEAAASRGISTKGPIQGWADLAPTKTGGLSIWDPRNTSGKRNESDKAYLLELKAEMAKQTEATKETTAAINNLITE